MALASVTGNENLRFYCSQQSSCHPGLFTPWSQYFTET